jgi:hypothetical protein
MVAVWSKMQLDPLVRASSLHVLKSTTAFAIAASVDVSESILQRVKVSAA